MFPSLSLSAVITDHTEEKISGICNYKHTQVNDPQMNRVSDNTDRRNNHTFIYIK